MKLDVSLSELVLTKDVENKLQELTFGQKEELGDRLSEEISMKKWEPTHSSVIQLLNVYFESYCIELKFIRTSGEWLEVWLDENIMIKNALIINDKLEEFIDSLYNYEDKDKAGYYYYFVKYNEKFLYNSFLRLMQKERN